MYLNFYAARFFQKYPGIPRYRTSTLKQAPFHNNFYPV
jgi:hypothetical protein